MSHYMVLIANNCNKLTSKGCDTSFDHESSFLWTDKELVIEIPVDTMASFSKFFSEWVQNWLKSVP